MAKTDIPAQSLLGKQSIPSHEEQLATVRSSLESIQKNIEFMDDGAGSAPAEGCFAAIEQIRSYLDRESVTQNWPVEAWMLRIVNTAREYVKQRNEPNFSFLKEAAEDSVPKSNVSKQECGCPKCYATHPGLCATEDDEASMIELIEQTIKGSPFSSTSQKTAELVFDAVNLRFEENRQ